LGKGSDDLKSRLREKKASPSARYSRGGVLLNERTLGGFTLFGKEGGEGRGDYWEGKNLEEKQCENLLNGTPLRSCVIF